MSLVIEFRAVVELGYAPKDSNIEKYAKQDFIANTKGMNALLSGLRLSNISRIFCVDAFRTSQCGSSSGQDTKFDQRHSLNRKRSSTYSLYHNG